MRYGRIAGVVLELRRDLRTTRGESDAERLQRQLPNAQVVKAFNTTTLELFEVAPATILANQAACFVAGDDTAAMATVGRLATDLGFTAVDCGPLRQARLLEVAGDLIRMIVFTQGNMGLTFAVPAVPLPGTARLGGREPSKLP